MQRKIIEEIEEELRNLQTRQLILGFVERFIYGVSIFSNSCATFKNSFTLFTRGELFESQNSIKFACITFSMQF